MTDRYELGVGQELLLEQVCASMTTIDRIVVALNARGRAGGRLSRDPLLAEVREERSELERTLRELNLARTRERGLRLVVDDA